jgi:NDP-sugar pyrophosphorylase family protein
MGNARIGNYWIRRKTYFRSHLNARAYMLEPFVLSLLEESGPCDMPTLLKRLRDSSKRLIAFPVHEPWLDIGRPADLEKLSSSTKGGLSD